MKTTYYFPLLLFPFLISLLREKTIRIETRQGKNYALFFAVNDYSKSTSLDNLISPIQNAKAIAQELEDNYGFQTEVVKNPTLAMIKAKLQDYDRKFMPGGGLDPDGQLLIYFSGRGIERYGTGFFMPVDGQVDNPAYTALQYSIWRKRIDAINCQHILVAIDAGYSSYFDTGDTEKRENYKTEYSKKERLLVENKARLFYTYKNSANETPDHSGFASKFLEALGANSAIDSILTSKDLYEKYLKNANSKLSFGRFGKVDRNANFFFFKSKRSKIEIDSSKWYQADLDAWIKARRTHTIEAYKEYLQSKPITISYQRQAEEELRLLTDERDWKLAKKKDNKEAYQLYLQQHPHGKYTKHAVEKMYFEIDEETLTIMGKVSGNLKSREIVNSPALSNVPEGGSVGIFICINSDGNIKVARVQLRGTTAIGALQQLALENAKKWVFEKGEKHTTCGTITYTFE